MKFKKLILLSLLLIFLFLSIGITTANENHTIDSSMLNSEDANGEIESIGNKVIEVNNENITANVQINENKVHIYAKASENVSGRYPEVGLKYSSNNDSYYYLKDNDNNVIYSSFLYKNEMYNKTFSDLKNGYYRVCLGMEYYYFTINMPTTYNLTIDKNNVSMSVFNNEKALYLTLLYENGTSKDKYDTWLERNITQKNYTLVNGEYKFRLYNLYTKEEIFVPFKIDVPLTYNVTTNYNNVTIEFNINHNFDYVLIDNNGNEIRENLRVLSKGFNQHNYTLPNGNYIFRITGEEPTDILFTINCTTNIDAYSYKNSIIINIDGNPLDEFRVIGNKSIWSWNNRNNEFKNLENGNYSIGIYENNEMIWSKIFEIKEPNTEISVDSSYKFNYGVTCKIYAYIPLNHQSESAKPVLIINGTTINGKETYDYDDRGYQYVFSFKRQVGKYSGQLLLDDGAYYAEPTDINVEVIKANPTLTVKTSYSIVLDKKIFS